MEVSDSVAYETLSHFEIVLDKFEHLLIAREMGSVSTVRNEQFVIRDALIAHVALQSKSTRWMHTIATTHTQYNRGLLSAHQFLLHLLLVRDDNLVRTAHDRCLICEIREN